jgi:DNA polymerase III delta prime subunit
MKYGKRNEVKIDPLKYNLALIGQSGIGKTTVIKEYCEKLCGENGYLFLEIGKEDGADAINGINYLNCPDWDSDYDEDNNSIGFATVIEDIVEHKASDWNDLKVIVIDTYDELFAIAEPEVVRMHNRDNPNKRVKSIKAAFGGFQAGEDKAIEIVLDALWNLKHVGVSFIVIGHTKTRNVTDPVTGEDYMQLTTNMSQKYFNAIKTKVHFLGVAAIDREIVKEKTGKKNVVTGQEIKKGIVKSETRKITFRDDNFVIDSKSRFADIVESIPLDSDALIKAITDAIKSELSKSGKSITDVVNKQKKENEKAEQKIADKEKKRDHDNELADVIKDVIAFIAENKTNMAIIKPILEKCKSMGYANPKEVTSIEDAKELLSMTKS